MDEKVLWVDCDCLTPEHSLRLTFWPEEEDGYLDTNLYVDFPLRKAPWYKRITVGIKHILGKGTDDLYNDIIWTPGHVERVQVFLDDYLKEVKRK